MIDDYFVNMKVCNSISWLDTRGNEVINFVEGDDFKGVLIGRAGNESMMADRVVSQATHFILTRYSKLDDRVCISYGNRVFNVVFIESPVLLPEFYKVYVVETKEIEIKKSLGFLVDKVIVKRNGVAVDPLETLNPDGDITTFGVNVLVER
jgi:head-tail adaptor